MRDTTLNRSLMDAQNIYYTTILSHSLTNDGKQLVAALKCCKLALFPIETILRHHNESNESFDHSLLEKRKASQLVNTSLPIYSLAMTGDNRLVCGAKGEFQGWELSTDGSQLLRQWSTSLAKQDVMINAMAYSTRDQRVICGCGDGNIYGYDMESGQLLFAYDEHEDYVNCLTLAGDESALFSGGEDGSVRVWDLRAKKCVSNLLPHMNAALSRPNCGKWIGALAVSGDWLVCGGGPRLSLWHIKSMAVANHFDSDCAAKVAAFYGDYILAGGNSPYLYVWEMNGSLRSKIETSVPNIFSVTAFEYKDSANSGAERVMSTAGTGYKIDIFTNYHYKDFELFVL